MGIFNITMSIFCIIFIIFIYAVESAPQREPEIINQSDESNDTEIGTKNVEHIDTGDVHLNTSKIQHVETNTITEDKLPHNINTRTEISAHVEKKDSKLKKKVGLMSKLYITIKTPIAQFIETPKVNTVLKNVGTCLVNGAMEIISFYFPAPLIPLIASAAGMIIPFEPVVMLRKRMPVTSYRRAFKTAINSFMGTFDRFKRTSESEEDPYMTRRFNRRFLKDNSKHEGDSDEANNN